MSEVQVSITRRPGAKLPTCATDGAAGMDLCAYEEVFLLPMERKLVPTGLKMQIPVGYEGQVRPRSGLALRHGIGIVNAPGTIDCDYRGEVGVILVNLGSEPVRLAKGERIAQIVFCPVTKAHIVEVDEDALETTARGEGGFGSTGG